ncbi:MAG: hypothetical protein HRT53_18580 [Colwellia sp.]|nr:hypothetical protein [Colwellia sp.]
MKLLLLILIILITGCASTAEISVDEPTKDFRQKALNNIDIQTCLGKGGVIKSVCMFAMPYCVQTFIDAGKKCSDSSDCAGDCRLEDDFVNSGTNTSGFCSTNSDPCGCYQRITNGKAEPALCVD